MNEFTDWQDAYHDAERRLSRLREENAVLRREVQPAISEPAPDFSALTETQLRAYASSLHAEHVRELTRYREAWREERERSTHLTEALEAICTKIDQLINGEAP